MEQTDRCWCGHQVRWHTKKTSPATKKYGIPETTISYCTFCLKRELKYKNWEDIYPQHEIGLKILEQNYNGTN